MGTRPFAIVTGASRGIGAEYARALAGRGFDLLLVSRDKDRMNRLTLELTGRHRVQIDSDALDLAEPEAAHRLYGAARQRRPTATLHINNAGLRLFASF